MGRTFPSMTLLRILALGVLTVICGAGIYGIIYAPRFFKVAAILLLVLAVYLTYLLVRHWLGAGRARGHEIPEAHVIEEDEPNDRP